MTICERIDEMIRDRGISRRQLALRAGIPPSTLQSAMQRNKGLSLDMLYPIAKVLGWDAASLLDEKNFWSYGDDGRIWDEDGNDITDTCGVIPLRSVSGFFQDENTKQSKNDLKEHHLSKRLLNSFFELNEEGQQKAVERVEELTEIPRYKK